MALTVVSSPLCSSGFGAAAEDLAVVASGSPVSVHGKRRVGGEASGLLRRRSLPRSTQEACNSGDFGSGGGSSLRRCLVVKMVRGSIGTVLLSRPNEAAVLVRSGAPRRTALAEHRSSVMRMTWHRSSKPKPSEKLLLPPFGRLRSWQHRTENSNSLHHLYTSSLVGVDNKFWMSAVDLVTLLLLRRTSATTKLPLAKQQWQ
nr:hypothetical protein Iba_chr14cCG3690 [Ipomoea batatas]